MMWERNRKRNRSIRVGIGQLGSRTECSSVIITALPEPASQGAAALPSHTDPGATRSQKQPEIPWHPAHNSLFHVAVKEKSKIQHNWQALRTYQGLPHREIIHPIIEMIFL